MVNIKKNHAKWWTVVHAVLALAGFVGSAAAAPVRTDVTVERQALEARVLAMREALRDDAAEQDSVAQWFNWPNWGNWNNWPNWGNWGNWFNR